MCRMSTLDNGPYPGGMTTHRKYLSRQEVADRAGVHLRTVKRWMDAGRLHYERDERTGRVWILASSPALKELDRAG